MSAANMGGSPEAEPHRDLWRAVVVLGASGVVAGGAAILTSLLAGVGFAQPGIEPDARVWGFHHANPLGGLLILLGGVSALAAGLVRTPLVALLAGLGLLAVGAAVPIGQAVGTNVLGGSASTVGLCLGLGAGLLAAALTAWTGRR